MGGLISRGTGDMLLMRCGFPPVPDGKRVRRAVIMDGLLFPSIRAAAGYAGVKPQSFQMALFQGRKSSQGHTIRYATKEDA